MHGVGNFSYSHNIIIIITQICVHTILQKEVASKKINRGRVTQTVHEYTVRQYNAYLVMNLVLKILKTEKITLLRLYMHV